MVITISQNLIMIWESSGERTCAAERMINIVVYVLSFFKRNMVCGIGQSKQHLIAFVILLLRNASTR